MKIKVKFVLFSIISVFALFLFSALFMILILDCILPYWFHIPQPSSDAEITVLLVSFLISCVLFGLFLAQPLAYIASLIGELSAGTYDLKTANSELYKQNGKLKTRYYLYKELIADMYALADDLQVAENERKKLEAAKRSWLAGISHDLKTPLSYITGYSSLLLDTDKDWSMEDQQKFLNEIHSKSIAMNDLVNDLNLSFKLKTLDDALPLHLTHIDIIEFSKRCLADSSNSPNAEGYAFSFQSRHTALALHVDEKLFYRAVQNILANAMMHNPKGTAIEMTVDKHEKENQTSISVTDNGTGMDKEVQSHLFSPYDSHGSSGNNSGGLGLSVVKSIVDAHGGSLLIDSHKDVGTTVRLIFPCADK